MKQAEEALRPLLMKLYADGKGADADAAAAPGPTVDEVD
jgi:hypothetical protein